MISQHLATIMAVVAGMDRGLTNVFTDPLDGVDIDAEYALIQNKESKLSARMRKMVIARYNRREEQI